MEKYETQNAIIESASITSSDRIDCLDVWLGLKYGGGGCQGFGGFALYLPKSSNNHNIMSVAGHHIYRIMEIAGVTEWDKLVGKTIRVQSSWSKVYKIGHIIKDDWFCPEEEYKNHESS